MTTMQINSPSVGDLATGFLDAEVWPYRVVKESVYRYDQVTGTWRAISQETLKSRIQNYDNKFQFMQFVKGGGALRNIEIEPNLRDKIADYLMHMGALRDDTFFDQATRGLAVANGFVTITAIGATLLEHSPDHRARSYVPIVFDGKADATTWSNTLHEAMREISVEGVEEEDTETPRRKARLLQEYIGAALFGMAPIYQRCMITTGGGNNGKSTILELIAEILFMPEDRTSTPPQMWEKEYYAAQLHDKKFNVVGELPAREIMTSSVFKQIVAGETTQGRHPRGKPFEFRPIAAHIFACNALPATGDYSEGYWRRFLVVAFKRTFAKVGEVKGAATSDDIKRPILTSERAGVLNWAIAGAVAVMAQNGYSIPQEHHEALTEWRNEADPVLAWAESALYTDDGIETPFGELYSAFQEWAAASGHKQLSTVSLGRRLTNIHGAKFRKTKGGKLWNIVVKPRQAWINLPRSVNIPPMVSIKKGA